MREREQCMLWGFDYLISRGSVTLTNSSSNLNSAPRCEEWGILGHWVQFRVHFEIHNEWLHLWVPTAPLTSCLMSSSLCLWNSIRCPVGETHPEFSPSPVPPVKSLFMMVDPVSVTFQSHCRLYTHPSSNKFWITIKLESCLLNSNL